MKTLKDIALTLDQAKESRRMSLNALKDRTGLTAVTLRGVLQGKKDPRATTLMAIARELGLELMLVPTEFAASIVHSDAPATEVESLVSAALTNKKPPL